MVVFCIVLGKVAFFLCLSWLQPLSLKYAASAKRDPSAGSGCELGSCSSALDESSCFYEISSISFLLTTSSSLSQHLLEAQSVDRVNRLSESFGSVAFNNRWDLSLAGLSGHRLVYACH